MEEITKKCYDCDREFPLTSFHKSPKTKDGRINKCKDCIKIYKRNLRIRKNNYELDSIEHEMFFYFSRMGVYLKNDEVEDVVTQITENQDKYLETLDMMQKKYGALAENYEDTTLQELRADRKSVQSTIISNGPGRNSKRRINQLDLEGNHIQTFNSIADAAMEVAGNVGAGGAITGCANGLCYQAYNFVWEYNDEWFEGKKE